MRVITTLTKKIDDEDAQFERSYEQTRSHIENFFRSVQDMASDRERTLMEQVDSKQAELVSKLKAFYSELDAAEKNCYHWLERQREVIERLKSNDISATGEYNACMAGLKQAEQTVKELNAQLVEILQRPPVITFTCDEQQADELKEAIKNFGEFDEYTTTTFQEPDKMAYFVVGSGRIQSNETPQDNYATPRKAGRRPPNEETDFSKAGPQYKALATDQMCQPMEYELAPLNKDGSAAGSTTIQPYSVIQHFLMKEQGEVTGALPTKVCIQFDHILVSEDGSIRCLQSEKLTKKITKVGKNKLRRPEGITYYSQKEKFLIVDSVTKKLIKVKPDTGKMNEVDLPHIFAPGDIAITTGPNPTIFITDTQSICVFKYSTNGAYQETIQLRRFGVKRPVGIVYMDGFLYIADIECHCIFKFDTEGVFSEKFGTRGLAPGCLNQPYGITALPEEKLAITESGNHRVSVFNSEGQFVQCFGAKGRDHGMFNMPKGISADSSRLVVVDYGNKRVQVFSLDTIMAEYEEPAVINTDDPEILYDTCN